MPEIMIARRSGAVIDGDGNRVFIRAGRSIADADHPLVQKYPKAWVPVNVTFRTDGSGAPVAEPDADSYDPAREGAQDALYADPEIVEHAEQFRRLAGIARRFNVLPDQPLTAGEVVDHLAAIIDEWQNGGYAQTDPGQEQAPEVGREEVRAWAKAAGLGVADKGRLSASVYAAYAEAH